MPVPALEKVYDAAEMLTKMRNDLLAAESRVDALEASIQEMEKEHADAFEDMRNTHDAEISELRHRLDMTERENATLTLEVEILRKNADQDMCTIERVATITSMMRLAVNKADDSMLDLAVGKAERAAGIVPDLEEFVPKEVPAKTPTNVRKLRPEELAERFGQLEHDIASELHPRGNGDDGQPAPAFLTMRPGVER